MAIARERYYIKKYNSVKNGYNQVYGSNIPTKEGREAIKKALTGIKRQKSSIEKQMRTKHKRYGSGRGVKYLGSNSKKVKCNETGDIFASISEANRWANTCKVGECCNGKRAHAGTHPITKQQLSWSFAD
jgi:ribosomal protein L9